jgi:glycosyltransferase involved in cell wall biosynthesis
VRVLHVSQPSEGGVARCVADAALDQTARGWQVAVACPPGRPLARRVAEAGVEVRPWKAGRAPGPAALRETATLRDVVRSWKPDLVHLHSSKAGLCGRLADRARTPTVFQPHAWSFYAVDGLVRRASVLWERLAARWAHLILCVSEGEREDGRRAGIRGRWAVVPNGIDLQAFAPADDVERRQARQRLGAPEGLLVVCAGRLSHQKGQDLLLEAWPHVAGSIPGASLVLVGDGPAEVELRRLAGDGVHFAGPSGDVAGWLAAADVVAVPSRWEGMSLTMLEAMARARSVVATASAGAREALGEDAGAVVPVGDPQAFAHALRARLLDEGLRTGEGRAGRRRAEAFHDVKAHVAALVSLYRGLVGEAQ